MAFNFTADEVFEMAEHLEREGTAFYNAAAESVGQGKLQDLFYTLAEWEVRHEKIFAGLRKDLTAKEQSVITFDPESESARYLKTLVDGMVSFEHTLKAESPKEILIAAIESEKDAVSFYTAMRNAVPEALGKSRIDKIIEEEAAHVRILDEQLGKLIGRACGTEIDTSIPKPKEEKKESKPAPRVNKDITCVGEEGKSHYSKKSLEDSVTNENVEAWGEDGIGEDSVLANDD
jgi:rubrerythrin